MCCHAPLDLRDADMLERWDFYCESSLSDAASVGQGRNREPNICILFGNNPSHRIKIRRQSRDFLSDVQFRSILRDQFRNSFYRYKESSKCVFINRG